MSKPKLLFLTSGRDTPSSRFRVMQYLPRLREVARPSVSPCRPQKDLTQRDFRFGGGVLGLTLGTLKMVSRLLAIARGPLHDLVYIERELLVRWSPKLEKLAMKVAPRSVFDFDDAIYLPNVSRANRVFGGLKAPGKVAGIVRRARLVVAGNDHLA